MTDPDMDPLLDSTVNILSELELDTLDRAWVTEIWDGQFTECTPLPDPYKVHLRRIQILDLLEQVMKLKRFQ